MRRSYTMSFITSGRLTGVFLAFALLIGAIGLQSGSTSPYNKHQKAFYAAQSVIDFVRPGLVITINSAKIASDGTITVTYTLTDPAGLPLDAAGVTTPGTISLGYVAAVLPANQEEYTAYTTRANSGPAVASTNQPGGDTGGVVTATGPGQYQYVFHTKAPTGFDTTATHTIGIYASRVLTDFDLGTSYASAVFNFVPNGAKVTKVHDIIKTASCNTCHDQLAWHGGRRRGIEMCVLCHTQQNVDTTTGGSLDLKVMIHEMHMGSQLPTVVAGKPLIVNGTDFSTIVDPADPRRCEVCHSQTTGAAQATAYLITPSRAACGACHDDVNFATGANHPGGFQADDTQCHNCHIPQGELPFDASIKGAHVVASDTAASYPQNPDTLITSIKVTITGVTNHLAGEKPVVDFTVKDMKGNPIALNDPTLEDMQFTMAGPTTDYGYTSFGSDVTTPGYVGEDGTQGKCDSSGNCTYTFQHAIPAKATGSYAIGVESERLENILTGTNSAQQVESGTPNQVFYFSVDGSPVQPRRTVVAETNCNQCHVHLTLHGNRRNEPEYCVMCHNPSDTDFSQRKAGDTPQTINMAVMIHRIHDGVNVVPAGGKPFVIAGFGGSLHDFSGVLYPAMGPTGDAAYLQNCAMCHTASSEAKLPIGLNQVVDPQGWINPVQATASACSGCHVSKGEAAHFLANTDSLGESCATCHATGAAYDVDKVHAQ
jgi:OmcA/MtrC family decaheme c-type cytochrome